MEVHLGSGSSASLTNMGSGKSVTSVLSSSPLSTPGGLDSISAVACIFPGTCSSGKVDMACFSLLVLKSTLLLKKVKKSTA